MLPHILKSFEIKKYYQNKPKFNCVYWRTNLPKVNDGAYVIDLDEFKSIGSHWLALCVNNNNITYFNSFGVAHIPKEIKRFIGNKNIITNIYRIQAYDSIMCEYFRTDLMSKDKSLLDYTNLFSISYY